MSSNGTCLNTQLAVKLNVFCGSKAVREWIEDEIIEWKI